MLLIPLLLLLLRQVKQERSDAGKTFEIQAGKMNSRSKMTGAAEDGQIFNREEKKNSRCSSQTHRSEQQYEQASLDNGKYALPVLDIVISMKFNLKNIRFSSTVTG